MTDQTEFEDQSETRPMHDLELEDEIQPFKNVDDDDIQDTATLESEPYFIQSRGVIIFKVAAKDLDNVNSKVFGFKNPKVIRLEVHASPQDPNTEKYRLPRSLGIRIAGRWAIPKYDRENNVLTYNHFSSQTPRDFQTSPHRGGGSPNPLIVDAKDIPHLKVTLVEIKSVTGIKSKTSGQ